MLRPKCNNKWQYYHWAPCLWRAQHCWWMFPLQYCTLLHAQVQKVTVTVYKFAAKYVNCRAGPQNKCHSWQCLRVASPHRAHSRRL